MSNAVNIPKLYAASWEKLLEKELLIARTASRKYDAMVSKYGDTVSVPIGFDTTLDGTYDGAGSIVSQNVSTTNVEIKVDTPAAFHIQMSEKDYIQVINSKEALADSVKRGIYKVRDLVDTNLGLLYSDAGIVGNSGSTVTISESNAYEVLQEMRILFDEDFVEKEGRFAVIPSRYLAFIETQIKNTFDIEKAMQVFGNGYAGKVAGWNLIVSENVYNSGGTYHPLFGVMGQSYALAMQKEPAVREERPTGTMDYAVLGSAYFGVKAVRSDKLGTIPVSFSSLLS